MRGGEERVATGQPGPHDRLRRHRDPRHRRGRRIPEGGALRGRRSRPLLDALGAGHQRLVFSPL